MGSHISNDDLVKDNRLSEDFTYQITARPEAGGGHWEVEAVPKPDAAIVWGKVVASVHSDLQPRDVRYFDEDGVLVRTMSFHDVQEFDGVRLPARMRVEPAEDPGEYTEITYTSLDFDVALDDDAFGLQALRK